MYDKTKPFFSAPNKQKSYELMKLNRNKLSQHVQFITGHAHMRRHDHIVNRDGSKVCSLCDQGEETPIHLIHECDALHVKSVEFFGMPMYEVRTNKPVLVWNTRNLYGFINLPQIQRLIADDFNDPSVPANHDISDSEAEE